MTRRNEGTQVPVFLAFFLSLTISISLQLHTVHHTFIIHITYIYDLTLHYLYTNIILFMSRTLHNTLIFICLGCVSPSSVSLRTRSGRACFPINIAHFIHFCSICFDLVDLLYVSVCGAVPSATHQISFVRSQTVLCL